MSTFVALFYTQEDIKETKVCPRCKQERPVFKRMTIPNFVPADERDELICMECKKAEPRVCPRCKQERPRFDEKGESTFYSVLKSPGEIAYICSICKGVEEGEEKPRNGWV